MERVARIPLVRTRRRKPKPPIYWGWLLLLLLWLVWLVIDLLKLLTDGATAATPLVTAADTAWVIIFRYGMRVADPDDTPTRYVTPLTVSLGLGTIALTITRLTLYGPGSG